MPHTLDKYRKMVKNDVMNELRIVAERARGRRLQNINSTAVGGGVAEILTRLVPLLRELGVDATWDTIKGSEDFFNATKAFHNALHGARENITNAMFDCYRATIEENLRTMEFSGDVVWIHDPQPAGLVTRKQSAGGRWVWRCHIDISTPDPRVWEFLRKYVEMHDASIFSMPDFSQPLPIPQYMVTPSIDPLSDKNRDLPQEQVTAVIAKFGLDPDRPILTQISRFDRLKDPIGVIAAYRMVKRHHDCQLILAGGGAPDDPEGAQVLQEVQQAAADDPDIHILLLPPFSDLEINALVRGSTIIFQKSLKEGFGLTVSEALWKKKPVIAGAVGGIKIQILDGITGFLVHSPEGAALRARTLLSDPGLRQRLGESGHMHVRQNFLLTRQVKDYLLVMLALEHPEEDVIHME